MSDNKPDEGHGERSPGAEVGRDEGEEGTTPSVIRDRSYEPFQVDIDIDTSLKSKKQRPKSGKRRRNDSNYETVSESDTRVVTSDDIRSTDDEVATRNGSSSDVPDERKHLTPSIQLLPSIKDRISQELDRSQRRLKHRTPVMRLEPKIAKAPVACTKLAEMGTDVLDFLATYCIIEEERLRVYEDVFLSATGDGDEKIRCDQHSEEKDSSMTEVAKSRQLLESSEKQRVDLEEMINTPNIAVRDEATCTDENSPTDTLVASQPLQPVSSLPSDTRSNLTPEEFARYEALSILSHIPGLNNSTISIGREYLERLDCSIDVMFLREQQLRRDHARLQDEKLCYIVDQALVKFSDCLAKHHAERYRELSRLTHFQAGDSEVKGEEAVDIPLRNPPEFSEKDEYVYKLLDERMLDRIREDSATINGIDLQLERLDERLAGLEKRLEQILAERSMVRMYCHEIEMSGGGASQSRTSESEGPTTGIPSRLRAHQGRLLTVEELLPRLSEINRYLITDNELAYISQLLELPGRRHIDFHLFSVIAALSEKVVTCETYARNAIENMDCEALLSKIETCKNLFLMLNNGECVPESGASATSLKLDLIAGGLEPTHVQQIVRKLTGTTPGVIDFLDFVTYIPLFIDVHRHIVSDPLATTSSK